MGFLLTSSASIATSFEPKKRRPRVFSCELARTGANSSQEKVTSENHAGMSEFAVAPALAAVNALARRATTNITPTQHACCRHRNSNEDTPNRRTAMSTQARPNHKDVAPARNVHISFNKTLTLTG